MLTTHAPDLNLLHSRSMHAVSHEGLEFVFIANKASGKMSGINKDEVVNVSYCEDGGTWASVAGKASVSNDREKIRGAFLVTVPNQLAMAWADRSLFPSLLPRRTALYNPLFRAWFGDTGKPNQKGDAEDERMQLIIVQPEEIRLYVNERTTVGKAVEVVTSAISGDTAEPGSFYVLSGAELEKAKGLMK